jgi:hypothetical protein
VTTRNGQSLSSLNFLLAFVLFRRVTYRDYPDLLQLQEANLFGNLPTEQRKVGPRQC